MENGLCNKWIINQFIYYENCFKIKHGIHLTKKKEETHVNHLNGKVVEMNLLWNASKWKHLSLDKSKRDSLVNRVSWNKKVKQWQVIGFACERFVYSTASQIDKWNVNLAGHVRRV